MVSSRRISSDMASAMASLNCSVFIASMYKLGNWFFLKRRTKIANNTGKKTVSISKINEQYLLCMHNKFEFFGYL